jgi:uncharacterized repeat protein (TIGR02543 family)
MKRKQLTALFAAALGLGILAGCKDIFHSEEADTSGYTIIFDADGGTPAMQTRKVKSDAWIGSSNMPSNPTKRGYTFDGWYTLRNGSGWQFTYSSTVTADMTVYAKWMEGVMYELTRNPYYPDSYIFDSSDFLSSDFSVSAGEQVTISFSVKTDTAMANFGIGIADWKNEGYGGYFEDGWIAPGWEYANYDVSADGQFHSYTWILTAKAAAPVGPNPLVFQFMMDSVIKSKVTITVKDVSITINPGLPANYSLAQSLTWLTSNAIEGGNYTITLKNNETIAPQSLSYGKNVSITLNGGTSERYIILDSSGSLFTVGNGVTLTLDNNVTLQGRSSNTAVLVQVNSGGTLVMNDGSKITGNTNYVYNSIDYAYVYGSGVGVSGGTLTMNGGEISGNTAYAVSSSSYAGVWGGGLYIVGGTFTMNGGRISGNTARISGSSSSFINGAGIEMNSVTFTMNGGEISGNIIYSQSGGSFDGGGICFWYGTFTMNGGIISGNGSPTVSGRGGGVYFAYENDTFIMSGGTISGNTASYGGGVYIYYGTFIKQSGGTIYGSGAGSSLKNTATNGDSYGHAVYVVGSPVKKRNSTAGSGVTLNSGSSSGWE